jgi:hypothetical protein
LKPHTFAKLFLDDFKRQNNSSIFKGKPQKYPIDLNNMWAITTLKTYELRRDLKIIIIDEGNKLM